MTSMAPSQIPPTLVRDMVEIEPVCATETGFAPVYGPEARSNFRTEVADGALDMTRNPDFVYGAYANLRHHQVRHAIAAAGFAFGVPSTLRLQLDDARWLQLTMGDTLDSAKTGDARTGIVLLAALLDAAEAGRKAGATHVELRIT